MARIQITDANGKDFSVDMNSIQSINGDIAEDSVQASDSKRNFIKNLVDTVFVNQQGEVIDSLEVIQDMASGKSNVIALDVEMEATHSGKNHNYTIYYEDSMEEDYATFQNPFAKPILKNHNSYSGEPLGRIKESWYGPSALTDERAAIHLKARVTDQDAIPKFLDGRYRTVSIGGNMGVVNCNICGKTILKDNKFKFCGHWRGESYKDQTCYWGARDITYNEVSVVNMPADDYAQIMKVTVITDKDESKEDSNKKGKDNMNGSAKNNDSKKDSSKAKNMIMSLIDEILGESAKQTDDKTNTATKSTEDNTTAENNGAAKDDTTNTTLEQTIADMQEELDKANKLAEDLAKELQDSKDEVDKLQKSNESLTNDNVSMKEQTIELAKANKSLVADNIIELESMVEKLEDSQKEERHAELIAMSMKELNDTVDKLKDKQSTKPATRTTAKVENPGLASGKEDNTTLVDADGNEIDGKAKKNKQEDSKRKVSIDDYAKAIVDRASKRQ